MVVTTMLLEEAALAKLEGDILTLKGDLQGAYQAYLEEQEARRKVALRRLRVA